MIFHQLIQQLTSLEQLLQCITPEQFAYKSPLLGQASIGQHTRHILELCLCATTGYEIGCIDYIHRKRDLRLEEDIDAALNQINDIIPCIPKQNKVLEMVVENMEETISTTYLREMVYNTEHTIHHFALIQVALREMNLSLVDENFGVASSTIQYRKDTAREIVQN